MTHGSELKDFIDTGDRTISSPLFPFSSKQWAVPVLDKHIILVKNELCDSDSFDSLASTDIVTRDSVVLPVVSPADASYAFIGWRSVFSDTTLIPAGMLFYPKCVVTEITPAFNKIKDVYGSLPVEHKTSTPRFFEMTDATESGSFSLDITDAVSDLGLTRADFENTKNKIVIDLEYQIQCHIPVNIWRWFIDGNYNDHHPVHSITTNIVVTGDEAGGSVTFECYNGGNETDSAHGIIKQSDFDNLHRKDGIEIMPRISDNRLFLDVSFACEKSVNTCVVTSNILRVVVSSALVERAG